MEQKKKSKLKWIVIAIVVVAVIGAIAGNGSNDDVHQVKNQSDSSQGAKSKDAQDNKEEATKKTEFTVGETAEYKDIQVTLKDIITSKGDDLLSKPEEGNEYAICIFEIVNNSDSDISISSVACFEAYCDDTSMNQDILGLQAPEAKKYNQLDGDIATGKKMKGAIVYQVPENWKSIEINVNPGFWSVKDIKFIAENK